MAWPLLEGLSSFEGLELLSHKVRSCSRLPSARSFTTWAQELLGSVGWDLSFTLGLGRLVGLDVGGHFFWKGKKIGRKKKRKLQGNGEVHSFEEEWVGDTFMFFFQVLNLREFSRVNNVGVCIVLGGSLGYSPLTPLLRELQTTIFRWSMCQAKRKFLPAIAKGVFSPG